MKYEITIDKNISLKGEVQLPSSKSISNRVLILNALCDGKCQIKNLSKANDTLLLEKLLATPNSETLNAEDAGTTLRFLLTYLALKKGNWKVTGTERLFKRPLKPLLDALKSLGVGIKLNKEERIIEIKGGTLRGGKVKVAGDISSQFISSLLLCGASMPKGLKLKIGKEIVSAPYIDMTLQLLGRAGIIYTQEEKKIIIEPQKVHPFKISVENDWSSAAFIYQLAALRSDSALEMNGLEEDSTQGDSLVADLMGSLGVKSTFKKDGVEILSDKIKSIKKLTFYCADFPDMVPALVVTCAVRGIKAEFYGTGHLRDKESDRIFSLRQNLGPYGIKFKEGKDKFSIAGQLANDKYEFNSFNDHRMAMCFASLALVSESVIINQPEVVKKSFPSYWKELKKLGFSISELI